MKKIKTLIAVIGLIIFVLSAIIAAGFSIYIWFTDWTTVRSFGYVVKMWTTYPIYKYSLIGAIIGYCMFRFGTKDYKL